jgi:hypothetical protein
VTRMVLQHGKPESDGIFARLLSEHVDHMFCRVRCVRRTDRTPPENWYA